jgi:ATP-dependent Clp protease adaptor protein ClpS
MSDDIWGHMPDDVLVKEPEQKQELKEPPKYAVVFINDDFTPMPFVVELLTKYFQHSEETATFIMLDVHEKGKGVAGIYSKDIAETKAVQCSVDAKENQHPLLVTIEPEI